MPGHGCIQCINRLVTLCLYLFEYKTVLLLEHIQMHEVYQQQTVDLLCLCIKAKQEHIQYRQWKFILHCPQGITLIHSDIKKNYLNLFKQSCACKPKPFVYTVTVSLLLCIHAKRSVIRMKSQTHAVSWYYIRQSSRLNCSINLLIVEVLKCVVRAGFNSCLNIVPDGYH